MSAEPVAGWILRNLRCGTGKPWLTEPDSDAYKMAAGRFDYSCEPVYTRATLDAAVAAARAEERERCANVCEDQSQEYEPFTGQPLNLAYQCSAAIRALKPEDK